jgi:hypothetical protein
MHRHAITVTAVRSACLVALIAIAAGCPALRPEGEKRERQKAAAQGRAWTGKVKLPALGPEPAGNDYLRYAFLNNAGLQAAYWQWRSAIERIPQDSSFPNVAVPFNVMLGGGNMKLWDRLTLGLANDPMTNIPYPSKVRTAGRRALEDARAAGERFRETKFLLQGKVLSTYYDLALLAENIRIQEDSIALLELIARQASVGASTGASGQQDLLRAQTELDLARNTVENLKSQAPPLAARMNALLGRGAAEPVPLPAALPEPRPLPVADDELIRVGSERSPELAALARDVAGRKEALDLARQAYIPDFGLAGNVTSAVGNLGGMVILPTRREAIKAGVDQARADIAAATAARVQYRRDLAASFILNLYVLRNDERQVDLFENAIIPRARETIQITQTAYAAGRASFLDLLEGQRTLLDARLVAAQLRMEREKALVAIETWSTVDVETLAPGAVSSRAMTKGPAGGGGM